MSGFADLYIQTNGSSRICGKRRVYGNQPILVWHASTSKRRHICDMGPELEALVTFIAPHKSAINQTNLACSRWERQASETQRNTPLNPTCAQSPKSATIRRKHALACLRRLALNPCREYPAAIGSRNFYELVLFQVQGLVEHFHKRAKVLKMIERIVFLERLDNDGRSVSFPHRRLLSLFFAFYIARSNFLKFTISMASSFISMP